MGGDCRYADRETRGIASRSLNITATLIEQPVSAKACEAFDDVG